MKKVLLFMIGLSVLVFALASTSYGWQGRMGGMEDPYGLISDEADFLIHPAKIAKGKGVKFYGDYRFTYTGVTDWDYDLDRFTTAGVLINYFHYDTSGQEYAHNALVGAAFPLWLGRMGLFFTYDGMRGDYGGHEDVLGTSNLYNYDLTSDLDNCAMRLLYGLPLGGFNLGGEVQFAYRQEDNENKIPGARNYLLGTGFASQNLTPFQLPYDSSYWEALLKGSLEGTVGPLDLEFTLRGGFIFAGDNSMLLTQGTDFVDMSGDVTGWSIGGDVWARYPMKDGLTLPFLVRVDYQSKTRDGEGPGHGLAGILTYESQERNLNLTVGGGLDKELSKGARIGAGIYYNYLHGESAITLNQIFRTWSVWDNSDTPASNEHQVMLRLAGELELSPTATLRMGLAPFYGWVQEDFTFTRVYNYTDAISLDGSHWGIGASLGGTIKVKPITLEPFINGGWQQYKLDGDGERIQRTGVVYNLWEMDVSRNEWSIGGGLSVLFDLP